MMRGGLFTRFFLVDGIRETDAYRQHPDLGFMAALGAGAPDASIAG
jgi:hypothetical protein